MKRSRLTTWNLLAGLTLACLSQSAFAGFRLEYHKDINSPPFFATPLYVDGEPMTPVVFYHSLSVIPDDYNFLGLDPRAFGFETLMNGFIVFADQNFEVPTHQELHGEGTPIWFVDTALFEAAAADGFIDLAELESLNPEKGTTTSYFETVHFLGGEATPFANGVSTGVLDNGGTYSMHITEAWLPPSGEHVIIRYELSFD